MSSRLHSIELTHLGLSGRLLLSWTMAGAVAAGGFFLGGTILLRSGPDSLPMFSVLLLTVLGAALGLLHAVLLAMVGRPADVTPAQSVRRLAAGAVWAIPGLAAAGIVALWIAIGPQALTGTMTPGMLLAVPATVVGIAICLWAAIEGWGALRNALGRWPERRTGIPVIAAIFTVAVAAFVLWRPEVWWTDLRVTTVGAVLLAAGVTIWVAIPVTWLTLHARERRAAARDVT